MSMIAVICRFVQAASRLRFKVPQCAHPPSYARPAFTVSTHAQRSETASAQQRCLYGMMRCTIAAVSKRTCLYKQKTSRQVTSPICTTDRLVVACSQALISRELPMHHMFHVCGSSDVKITGKCSGQDGYQQLSFLNVGRNCG